MTTTAGDLKDHKVRVFDDIGTQNHFKLSVRSIISRDSEGRSSAEVSRNRDQVVPVGVVRFPCYLVASGVRVAFS